MVQFEDIAKDALASLGALHAAVLSAEARLRAQLEHLSQRVEAMREKERRMLAVAATRRTKVKLNVGGRVFAVHKDEILKRKDSLLYYMLCSEVWEPGEDGRSRYASAHFLGLTFHQAPTSSTWTRTTSSRSSSTFTGSPFGNFAQRIRQR